MAFLSKLFGGKPTDQQLLNQQLIEAVIDADQGKITQLLVQGANINMQNAGGVSLLYYAFQNNNLELAKFLIESGADIELADNEGASPLIITVLGCSLEGVRLLLNAGADPERKYEINVGNNKKASVAATDLAYSRGYVEIYELLQTSFSLDQKIYEAANRGDRDRIEKLLDNGANVNAQNIKGQPLLFHALCKRDVEMTKLLINRGADVELPSHDGMTALALAVAYGFTEGVRHLLAAGANPDRMTGSEENPRTALWFAEKMENTEICELLISKANHDNTFVQKLNSEDPMLVQANAAALQDLPRFIKMFNERDATPGYVFSVKVPIEDENGREHLWLMVYEISDQFILGTVGNDPTVIKNFKYGDAIQSPYESVEDIIVTDSETKFVMGGHTLKAMIDRNNP